MVHTSEMDLVVRRLMALRAPKEAWYVIYSRDFSFINCSLKLFKFAGYSGTQGFILLVLLTSFLSTTQLGYHEYQVVEFFSGASLVASTARMLGLRSVALDIEFDKVTCRPGAFDLRTPAGFVCLGLLPRNM